MTKSSSTGLWEYELSIPQNVTMIDFAFTDNIADYSTGTWDDNGGIGIDWHIDVYPEGLSVVVVSPEVENPYGNPMRSPVFASQNEIVPITISTVSTGVPADSLYLIINGTEVSNTVDDTLKYDFDTPTYNPDEFEIQCVAKDVTGVADTTDFAIVVRPDQVNQIIPSGIKPGINYINSSTVTLALFAPYKEFVYLIGDFNDWKVDNDFIMNMYQPDADSTMWWITLTDLIPGMEYSFQYLTDGEIRIADPYTDKVLDPWNDQYIPSSIYPNLMEYPQGKTREPVSILQTDQAEYEWQYSNSFEKPDQKDLIIYELLIRDFLQQHDYNTLIDTLDYLENLGINAIELMPINEFEGNSSWGYNPSFYFAPDKYYGTKNDLKAFVDECHRRGIAVIQDMVLNHSFGQSPLVRLYWDNLNSSPAENNPWYNMESPNTVYSWGYDFDHESTHTKSFADRVLHYWIEEYKVDGFRLDFTKGFTNTSGDGSNYDAKRIAILERIADQVWDIDTSIYVILEHFAPNTEEKELSDYGFILWGNSNYNYNEATMGYHSDSKSDFSWGFYKNRGWIEPNLVTYMESHDEERLMYKNLQYGNSLGIYNIKNLDTALDRQKLASVFFFTLPGPKMIWQFGELGYDFSIDFNTRLGEKPIRWDYFRQENRRKLYDFYSRLIKLRNEEVFRSPNTQVNLWLNDLNGLKRIKLSHSSMSVIVIGNFGIETQSIKPEFFYTGYWYDYFSGTTYKISDANMEFLLEPGQFRIFSDKKLSDNLEVYDSETSLPLTLSLSQNYPNPFNPKTTIKYTVPSVGKGHVQPLQLKIYNILGNEIATLIDEIKPTGIYEIDFDGSFFGNGIYFYTLSIGGKTMTKKMLLLK
jgi:glycosidase